MIIPSERSVPPVPWALLLGLLVLLAAFGSLGEEVWVHGGFLWEKALLLGLHAHASPALDGLMSGVTFVGGPKVMLPLALLGLAIVWKSRPQPWILSTTSEVSPRVLRRASLPSPLVWRVALIVGGAAAINFLTKLIFHRVRPHLWPSLTPEADYSFPSGHAMGAAAVATAVGLLLWQHRGYWLAWALGLLFVLGVGWSRVYLGVHYPSDVLAGWMGSVGWVAALHMLFSPAFHELRRLWREALHRQMPNVVSPPDETKGVVPAA